jgi:putative adhesin
MAAPLSRRLSPTRPTMPALALASAVALAGAVSACVPIHDLAGRATDEWTRSYPLNAGGEFRVANTNGRIDIEGTGGSTVEVRAERIARGATDAAARELLPRIQIKEDATPDRVSLETERMSGILLGVSFEVRYHVRLPRHTTVTATNTNGQVVLTGLSGKVNARTTNGGVKGDALTGAVEARSTNGQVAIDLASVGSERIALHTTNGGVVLTLPELAKADLSASVTNGGISVGEFQNMEVGEKSRRRFEARLNGGGTSIELTTTNGGVRIRPRNSVSDTDQAAEDGKERRNLHR